MNDRTRSDLFAGPGIGGLAVVLGPPSGGLTCRDFDDAGSYDEWRKVHRQLAIDLPTVQTGRGKHVLFRMASGSSETVRKYCDGELRMSKCYSVVPPSKHPSGVLYRWDVPLLALPPVIDPYANGLAEGGPFTEPSEPTEPTDAIVGGCERDEKQPCVLPETLLNELIEKTLPERFGQRESRLWAFAQELRAHLPQDTKAADLKPICRAWYKRALPTIATREWAATWLAFERAFRRVQVAAGERALDIALERARSATPPAALREFADTPEVLLLGSICRELSELNADGPFFLSTRNAGDLLGVSHTKAAEWLRLLRVEGLIECVKPGTLGVNGKAPRFEWRGGPEPV